jgi:AsmA protein
VIPDLPVDLSALRDAALALDAEVTIGTLRARAQDWRNVSVRASLAGGKLRADPLAVITPGGPLTGSVSADASGAAPHLALVLRSGQGGVDPAPLFAAFGSRSPLSGRAALDLALQGEGAGLRALAASLNGHVGLGMTDGQIDPRLIAGVAAALRGVVPDGALGGATSLRCLALRFAVENGIGRSQALLVQTGVASATGGGSVNLRDETLALRLNPLVRIGDVSVTTPLSIGGTFAKPTTTVDPSGAASAAAGILGGLARQSDDRDTAALGALAEGLLGGRRGAASPSGGDCAGQLAVARGEAPAAAPSPAPQTTAPQATPPSAQQPASRPREQAVQDLLRGLLGR